MNIITTSPRISKDRHSSFVELSQWDGLHLFVLTPFRHLEDFRSRTLVCTGNQLNEPRLTVSFFLIRDPRNAIIVEFQLLWAGTFAFFPYRGHGIYNILIIALTHEKKKAATFGEPCIMKKGTTTARR